eukprot:TRINITY_DN25516_c0_g1_i2.p1 TRINITY_DN25516_c0_g1~~TRINITY_DN25516_c0_g1_i2.p1  ORF type:complete len:262 (-),score=42.35 TRINITY_DN25516_c0_g1_i2:199-984(-)
MQGVEMQRTRGGDPSVSCSAWLQQVPDSVLVRDLAIPGTHNSACVDSMGFHIGWNWARCQQATLEAQLHMGVRYFDLRLADCFHDDIYVTHTLCTSMTLAQSVEVFSCFLESHPSEFVMVCMKKDWKHRGKWKRTSDARMVQILEQLPLSTPIRDPMVGDLRGQCIVVALDLPGVGLCGEVSWRDSLFSRCDCWDLQNTQGAKLKVSAYLEEAQQVSCERIRFLGCNVVVGVKWPQMVAKEMNPWLRTRLKQVSLLSLIHI